MRIIPYLMCLGTAHRNVRFSPLRGRPQLSVPDFITALSYERKGEADEIRRRNVRFRRLFVFPDSMSGEINKYQEELTLQ
ncbi:hypothetical protein R70723_18460 [Paenibacillus sp. FSL R7-0273]|nr:hypothetical protein R70723_18460 [Paenibacillus sp. FSL R7-0273]OMF95789.1 hypothetical protein BK144_04165 [Paenibacillus sp. FSL R7-0273]